MTFGVINKEEKMLVKDNDYKKFEKDLMDALNSQNPSLNILERVLKATPSNVNRNLFFKYLFARDAQFNEAARRFLELIDKNQRVVILIHGYARIGKSTFLDYIRWAYNNEVGDLYDKQFRYKFITFDFTATSSDLLYKDRFVDIFCSYFKFGNKENCDATIKNMEGFIEFYDNFQENISQSIAIEDEDDEEYHSLKSENTYFNNFAIKSFKVLQVFLSEIDIGNKYTPKEKQGIFHETISKYIDSEDGKDVICFLFLWIIYCQRSTLKNFDEDGKKSKCPRKLILIFDNLDDLFKDNDEWFFYLPQFTMSCFIEKFIENPKLLRCLNKALFKDEVNGILFKERLRIIYSFRTANFLSFVDIITNNIIHPLGCSSKLLISDMIHNDYITLKTMSLTQLIIKKRIQVYEELIYKFGIEKPTAVEFIKMMSENLLDDHSDESTPRTTTSNMFRLWNGEKDILWRTILDNIEIINHEYFDYTDHLNKCKIFSLSEYKILVKGVYDHLFLRLLDLSGVNNRIIELIHSYRDSVEDKKKNLRRFMLNYIINGTISKKSTNTMSGIPKAGVGLYDFLKDINLLIRSVRSIESDKLAYDYNEIEDFFEDLHRIKSDDFSQLVTIFKSQIEKGCYDRCNKKCENAAKTERNRIYYNIANEVREFRQTQSRSLNQIRLFSNHNAEYISSYMLSFFESYSFSCHFKKPLLFATGINSENEGYDMFEFRGIIDSVYEYVESYVNNLVDFYIKSLLDKYPPEEFVYCDFFSVKGNIETEDEKEVGTTKKDEKKVGDFQFRIHIQRHINYLERFRRVVVNHNIADYNDDQIALANNYLAEMIVKYIDLYSENFMKIRNAAKEKLRNDGKDLLKKTYDSYNYKKADAQLILKANGRPLDENGYHYKVDIGKS